MDQPSMKQIIDVTPTLVNETIRFRYKSNIGGVIMRSFSFLISLTTLVLVSSSTIDAAVTLASPFTHHAVLQRDQPIPVWGTADAGEQVTVTFDGQRKTGTAGADGRWLIKLDAHSAGGPYEMTVAGTNTINLSDILVGEVWICSGQSNMEWSVKKCRNSDAEIASATFPLIRHFKVGHQISDSPLTTCGGTWTVCSPETVGEFTAAGYYFGRKLHQELNVPIGLLNTSWGGTPAEAWTSMTALSSNPTFTNVSKEWFLQADRQANDYAAALAKYKVTLEQWTAEAAAAKVAGKETPTKPREPQDPAKPHHQPAVLFNGMVNPLIPYGIKGAIWYQGEANASRAAQYQDLLSLMITDWRAHFGQGNFSFYVVQLANYKARAAKPSDSDWAYLREAQHLTTKKLTHTGLAVTIDIGEEKDIHPKNKQDVGLRLALHALAKDYGKQLVYSGPVFQELQINGAEAVIRFNHVGGGLMAKGDKLTGFAIAGEDKTFVWANAQIVGDTVVVSAPSVSKPVAVRYAWADNPECNLYNKAGLPAVPFRTDQP
jgi:sialate O-acetylesterase